MPKRLAVIAFLVILIMTAPGHAAPPTSPATSPATPTATSTATGTGTPTPSAEPSQEAKRARHRLFYANAQRESLTGAANARHRMATMVTALRRSHADLGVLVELEGGQPAAFRARTRAAGHQWGLIAFGSGVRNAVIYNPAVWTPVSRATIATYWNSGRRTRTPVVVLRATSGEQVGVIAVHNPRDNKRLRGVNNRQVLAAVRRLQRQGIGVLVAGDFNTGRPALCLYTHTRNGLSSATTRHRNACRHRKHAPIDQAFATSDVRLRGYRRTPSRATDHGAVYSVGFRVRSTRPAA